MSTTESHRQRKQVWEYYCDIQNELLTSKDIDQYLICLKKNTKGEKSMLCDYSYICKRQNSSGD